MSDSVTNFFQKASSLKVLIVGDAMVDAYIEGQVDRVSPEAPVPVLLVNERRDRLGGAANVALNVKAMGASPILCTVIGDDNAAERLDRCLAQSEISSAGVLRSSNRTTTVKTRVMTRHQQMMRVDEEDTSPLNQQDEQKLLDSIQKTIQSHGPEVLIFQDYNKGILTPNLIDTVTAWCKEAGIPVCVDPKHKQFFAYREAYLFKPNLREVIDSIPECPEDATPDHLSHAAQAICDKLDNQVTMITLGARGLFLQTGAESRLFSAHIRDIADVSGAGDSVISLAALGIAAGLEPSVWAQIANLAGGLVCESVGVVPVDKAQLEQEAIALFHPH